MKASDGDGKRDGGRWGIWGLSFRAWLRLPPRMAAPYTQPACGRHGDRRIISDAGVRVSVPEDPSVALNLKAGIPPCSWVSSCVSLPPPPAPDLHKRQALAPRPSG